MQGFVIFPPFEHKRTVIVHVYTYLHTYLHIFVCMKRHVFTSLCIRNDIACIYIGVYM